MFQLFQNMGLRYMLFRAIYHVRAKSGLLRRSFPSNPPVIEVISLDDWKKNIPAFFFYGKNPRGLKKQNSDRLNEIYNELSSGIYTFFGNLKYQSGSDSDWITNPVSKYKYDIGKHWSAINDLSEEEGDIKFVWEKARFSFLYDIIRFDYHQNRDCAESVFQEINSFIDKNPINFGPNYKCSQEISLRILNWTFALYYYKDSDYLTDLLFKKVMNSIYWQIHHVYHNIRFSRIAVRNNHAITETLLLYLSGILFPFLPDVKSWSKKGKKWFEEEIAFQIFNDGTYLQFSNNYHRVVVQLLTIGIRLTELNNKKLSPVVYRKAEKSLEFLYNSMDLSTGVLPNYGSNDGALFFKLNDDDFRDYRPQLQGLSYALGKSGSFDFGTFMGEDLFWFGFTPDIHVPESDKSGQNIFSYNDGGFYIARENETMTYIRCGNHKQRPAHADNLHLDIWHNGINYFRDSGTFMYNTDPELIKYFMGTLSHNTVMLDDNDQMLKGPRFIWYYWSQAENAELREFVDRFEFEGTIRAFRQLHKNIRHNRKIRKSKSVTKWTIEDNISGTEKYLMHQIWHFNPDVENLIRIKATDLNGKPVEKVVREGWYSTFYGVKEKADYWCFSSRTGKIITDIEILG